jgi:hypothetical protein
MYINEFHKDIFYELLYDVCDGSYVELFSRDEEINLKALQVFKYNVLGFYKIDGSKNKKKI